MSNIISDLSIIYTALKGTIKDEHQEKKMNGTNTDSTEVTTDGGNDYQGDYIIGGFNIG